MNENTDNREAADFDDGDARAQARRALQDAYDWRDDEEQHPYAAAASAGQAEESRSERAAVRRLRRSTSRTVGV